VTRSAVPSRPDGRRLPATASTGVAGLLRARPRPVEVLAAFDRALYLAHDGGVLAVETTDGVHLPNGVVVARPAAGLPLAPARSALRGTVGDGAVEVGGLSVRVVRWRRARPVLRAVTAAALERAGAAAATAVAARAAPLPVRLAVALRRVAEALDVGRDDDAFGAAEGGLLGLGPGLTPSGDDVLAGLVAGTQLLAEAVVGSDELERLAAAAERLGGRLARVAPDATTSISAALLGHAARGEVAAPAADLLAALTGTGPSEPAVDRLLAVGSTSGRDLGAGLLAAAALVTATAAAPTGRIH
jgi:hypothetical protein